MMERIGLDHAERPRPRASRGRSVPLAAAMLALLLACLLGAAATAGAAGAAKPGKPTARTPKGTITITAPTFTWTKPSRATKYEVRVYQGSKQLLKKTGLTKTSWKTTTALPKNVGLTWKVRASNSSGAGLWSASLVFKMAVSTAKSITAFSFQGLTPPAVGAIDEGAHTIALTVPYGTDVTHLVATFTKTGGSVKVGSTTQVSGTTANDFTNPVTYTVTAADASKQNYVVTVTVASADAKAITAFSIPGQTGATVIDEAAKTIALTMPYGSGVTALVASFATTGASVAVAGLPQASGVTANDFTSPVTYTVTAADASTQDYVVTVTVAPSPAKSITAFSFQGLDPAVTGAITEATHTIALTVPYGTDITHLVATFTTTGASVAVAGLPQVCGVTVNDFSSPVTYTVTAADASTQDYVVTVTVAPSPAKSITAFSFQALVPAVVGDIDQGAHTIDLIVPSGTDVTHLVATFTTTGASVKVGSTTQVSGTTANDFTNPVTYTVKAADASTQNYVVTVTVALKIGDEYGGGIVAYIYQSGDPGYVAGETHGLIVAVGDLGAGIQWWNGSYLMTGATGTALGTGSANTDTIISAQGSPATSYAAGLARAYTGGGYSDWYLPSKAELHKAYLNKAAIGGYWDARYYWTSSEGTQSNAWLEDFTNGTQSTDVKQDLQGVRAFRSF